jgi:hypothetical protein
VHARIGFRLVLIAALIVVPVACASSSSSSDESKEALGISSATLTRYSLQFIPLARQSGSIDDARSIAERIYPHLVVRQGSYGRLIDSGVEVLHSGWVVSVDPVTADLDRSFDWCLIAVDPASRQIVDLVGGSLLQP